jgi:ABC-type multidrug transport system permease subunit
MIKKILNIPAISLVSFLCFLLCLLLSVLMNEHNVELLLFAIIFYMQYSHATIVEKIKELRGGENNG